MFGKVDMKSLDWIVGKKQRMDQVKLAKEAGLARLRLL